MNYDWHIKTWCWYENERYFGMGRPTPTMLSWTAWNNKKKATGNV